MLKLKPCENFESDLVLIRNCATRFANSADPSKAFRSLWRRTSHMVSLSFSNPGQQSKVCCTNYAISQLGQFRGFSGPIGCRSLRRPIFPILAWIIMLLSARAMVLNFWRTSADGSAVRLKVIILRFSVFRVSARCSSDRWPPAVLYADAKVWRIGECNGYPFALHLVAFFGSYVS